MLESALRESAYVLKGALKDAKLEGVAYVIVLADTESGQQCLATNSALPRPFLVHVLKQAIERLT